MISLNLDRYHVLLLIEALKDQYNKQGAPTGSGDRELQISMLSMLMTLTASLR
jgi:hypothetical protein